MQESKGKKINRSGVEFEKKTNITDYLISKGFSKDKFDGGVLFKNIKQEKLVQTLITKGFITSSEIPTKLKEWNSLGRYLGFINRDYLNIDDIINTISTKLPEMKNYDGKKSIFFCSKRDFIKFMKNRLNYDSIREPDESFIIMNNDNTYNVIIIEKKNQNVEGSVEQKLWGADTMRAEYCYAAKEQNISSIKFDYMFCLCDFLHKKFPKDNLNKDWNLIPQKERRFSLLKKIFLEQNIRYFNGDGNTYFNDIYQTILNK